MRIKFWGTRGSLPCSINDAQFVDRLETLVQKASEQGIETTSEFLGSVKSGSLEAPTFFGGDTTCLEISHEDKTLLFDMGSGLRLAGTEAMKLGRKEFKIFLTHMHWDHIMGLPFFVPIHIPGTKIEIYHVHDEAPDHVKILFNGTNFPVPWDVLPSDISFHKIDCHKTVEVDGMEVTPFLLDHPGGCYGYHVEADGKRITYSVDNEYKRFTPDELGADQRYYTDTDLLVYDGQYAMSEIAARFDWGHSSPNLGVDLALREVAKKVAFTHHDPWSDCCKLRAMLANAEKYKKTQMKTHAESWAAGNADGPELIMAYDGLEVEL